MSLVLAFRNSVHNISGTILSITGIIAAIVLIFMQLGFRGAVITTSTSVLDGLDFDLVVRSKNYLQVVDTGRIKTSWTKVLQSQPTVVSVSELNVGIGQWRKKSDGTSRAVMILGTLAANSPFIKKHQFPDLTRLKSPNGILVDTQTHPTFEPSNGFQFSQDDLGTIAEINSLPCKVEGTFQLGTGLAVNGSIVAGNEVFFRLFPMLSTDTTSMTLVKIQKGLDVEEVARELRLKMATGDGRGIEILTRKELSRGETNRWLYQTPIGLIFTLGVCVSAVIASVIVYMILASDVRNKLHEYATLSAIGYTGRFLASVVLFQSVLLAIYAFVPAFILATVLYQLTSNLASVPLAMNLDRVLFVFGLSVGVSAFSGFLAMTKLWKAEPASLF